MADTVTLPVEAADARTVAHVVLPNRTYADFVALPEGTLAQLIDGEIIVSPAPNLKHQIVTANLFEALRRFVGDGDLGLVIASPVDVRLTPGLVLQPDLVFVARERLGLLGTQEIEGAPDLVVEVLSRSTGTYDLTSKRAAYEEAGVREYWIVDPDAETVEVLALTDAGYVAAGRVRTGGRAASGLLDGFAVEVDALFAPPGGR